MPRPTAHCSMPSAASTREAAEVGRALARTATAEAAVAQHQARGRARAARGGFSAPRGRGVAQACAGGGRGDRARRAADRDDAGRKGRRAICATRMSGRGLGLAGPGVCGAPCAGWNAAQAQAPALIEPAVKALRRGAHRAWTKRAAHLERALRPPITIRAELERIEERLFALRAAGRKYNVPVDDLAALGCTLRRRSRPDRCRRASASTTEPRPRARRRRAYAAAAAALSQRAARSPRSSTRR